MTQSDRPACNNQNESVLQSDLVVQGFSEGLGLTCLPQNHPLQPSCTRGQRQSHGNVMSRRYEHCHTRKPPEKRIMSLSKRKYVSHKDNVESR